ncbi:DUF6285 domain-containing protein [Ketobacter sp.]|uniref:DUF6285 domain-containing protein n=1 Tax=Ketobacter sp. TaxID=2083498 RepID=UPI000F1D8938|nr:DUF6285 domain-containing protein [Ketobacter sp.]RLU00767.1 MAG: hypothetical protein D9N14_05780 [Ketobacter sp.]
MPLNRPTQDELLEAVAEYLSQPVVDTTADRFYRRVACNVVELVRREQALQSGFQNNERQHLKLLLADDEDSVIELNRRLHQAIASGDLPLSPTLTEALLAIAKLKLDIDNPRYAL